MISKASIHRRLVERMIDRIVRLGHISNVITSDDIERAIDIDPFLSSISYGWRLDTQDTKSYPYTHPKYIFTKSSLSMIQKFIDYFDIEYPKSQMLYKRFPLFVSDIDHLYESPKSKTEDYDIIKKFVPCHSSEIFHITNSSKLFERYTKIPNAPNYFRLDVQRLSSYPKRLIDSEKIQHYSDTFRIIRYSWIGKSITSLPHLLDLRNIQSIPIDVMNSHYFSLNRFDGMIFNDDAIVLFDPNRWISFEQIEYACPLYLAINELLNIYEMESNRESLDESYTFESRYDIVKLSEKYNVDKERLEMLFKENIAFSRK